MRGTSATCDHGEVDAVGEPSRAVVDVPRHVALQQKNCSQQLFRGQLFDLVGMVECFMARKLQIEFGQYPKFDRWIETDLFACNNNPYKCNLYPKIYLIRPNREVKFISTSQIIRVLGSIQYNPWKVRGSIQISSPDDTIYWIFYR